jgi:hypothetical protein
LTVTRQLAQAIADMPDLRLARFTPANPITLFGIIQLEKQRQLFDNGPANAVL